MRSFVLLGFGHVHILHEKGAHTERQATYFHRICERVLRMRGLSGASSVSQVVADIPLHLIEANGSTWTKQQMWVKKRPNEEVTEKNLPKLMEEEFVKPINSLNSKILHKTPISESSALKLPEPNAPL